MNGQIKRTNNANYANRTSGAKQSKKKRIEKRLARDTEPDFIRYIDEEIAILAKKSIKLSKQTKRGAAALIKSVREDVNAVRERDPAARSN